MTPSAPSVPMNRCFRSKPALFFSTRFSIVSSVPSASATSRPSTDSRIMPKRSTRMPPALVAVLPPTWQLPRAPRSTGKNQPSSATRSCSVCSVTPAWTMAVPPTASMSFDGVELLQRQHPFASMGIGAAGQAAKPPWTQIALAGAVADPERRGDALPDHAAA